MKDQTACFVSLSFAGLVVLARSLNPIPSRTRPLNSSAPMVLWLKPWESRSLPGLPKTKQFLFTCHDQTKRRLPWEAAFLFVRAATPPIFDRRSTAHRFRRVQPPFTAVTRRYFASPELSRWSEQQRPSCRSSSAIFCRQIRRCRLNRLRTTSDPSKHQLKTRPKEPSHA